MNENDEDDSGDHFVEIEPERDAYEDRLLTLTGQHHFALGCLLSDMALASGERLARRKGKEQLDSRELLELLGRFKSTETSARPLLLDGDTNAVRHNILGAEANCVGVVAHLLGVDEAEATQVLAAYSVDLDERDEYPTSSFKRWHEGWLKRTASEEEAAE